MEISLHDIVLLICKRLRFIFIFTVLSTAIFYVFQQYIKRPVYTASVKLYVNAGIKSEMESLNELNYAQKVVTTYINFLQTKAFYREIVEDIDVDYTEEQLERVTTIATVSDTEIFKISVSTYSAWESYTIAKAMQRNAPTMIANMNDTARILVVDPVVYPKGPTGLNIVILTGMGGISFLFLSALIAFLLEIIDNKVKSKEDLKIRYESPIIGVIPSFHTVQSNKKKVKIKKEKHSKDQDYIIGKEQNGKIDFPIKESYKMLRTNLLYLLRDNTCRKILINSPSTEEGKSTTCTNIGISIAQTGARVLIIDCDLRKGRLHKLFHLQSYPGISNVLSGMYTFEKTLNKTEYDNLHVLTLGSIPPNPAELLASSQMEDIIRSQEENYDYIIFDSPPVNVVSDALSLAKLADGVVLVIRENKTTHPSIESAMNQYKLVDARILGLVLNGDTAVYGSKKRMKYYYADD